jgi:hypothetical protein
MGGKLKETVEEIIAKIHHLVDDYQQVYEKMTKKPKVFKREFLCRPSHYCAAMNMKIVF